MQPEVLPRDGWCDLFEALARVYLPGKTVKVQWEGLGNPGGGCEAAGDGFLLRLWGGMRSFIKPEPLRTYFHELHHAIRDAPSYYWKCSDEGRAAAEYNADVFGEKQAAAWWPVIDVLGVAGTTEVLRKGRLGK